MKRIVFVAVLWLCFYPASSQEDTSVISTHLPVVTIESNRMISFGSTFRAEQMDSLLQKSLNQSTVAELLGSQSAITLKTYGTAGLVTSSVRGGSASHLAITWNGFNISNPSNGQSDLNLLPAGNDLQWKFFPGGSSSLWGTGAVAGTLCLETTPGKKNEIIIGTEYRTINDSRNSVITSFTGKKMFSTTRFWYNNAQNNFEFVNTARPGSPTQRLTHAGTLSFGMMQDILFRPSPNHEWNIHLWNNKSVRQIPPSLLQLESSAEQTDIFTRIATEYRYNKRQNFIYFRTGYFNDLLNYSDSVSDIISISRSDKFIGEGEARLHKSGTRHWFQAGINYQHTEAENSGYAQKHTLDLYAFFGSWKFISSRFESTLNLRQEYCTGYVIPFAPSFSSRWKANKSLIFNGSVSKNFRLPTFNDLYWSPGGNPLLQPESGWSQEIRTEIYPLKKKDLFGYSLTFYNRTISNWIIWLPGEYYWSPQNIMKVWSRGFENRINVSFRIQEWNFISMLKYDYVRSTDETNNGRQLIYIPQDAVNATISAQYKYCRFGFSYHYTGYRFISNDHTQWLPSWSLFNFHSGVHLRHKRYSTDLYMNISNLLNVQVESIPWQPLPGRFFTIGCKFSFQLPTNLNHS